MKNYSKVIIIISILLFSLILKYINISKDSLTWDEFYAYLSTTLSLKESFKLYYIEDNPPLFFFILRFTTKLLGSSEASLRFISMLSISLCSLLIFIILFDKTKNYLVSFAGSLTFLFSPLSEYYAHLSRPYALLSFLFLLSFYFSYRLFEDYKTIFYYLFILTCASLLYTHYYSFFLIISIFLSLLIFSKTKIKMLISELIAASLILILWLPWTITFLHQFNKVKSNYWIPKPSLSSFYDFFHNHLQYSPFFALSFILLFFIKNNKKFILYLLAIIFIFLFSCLTYTFLLTPVFIGKRVAILLLPYILIFIFMTFYSCSLSNYFKTIFYILMLSYSALNFYKFNISYPHLENWKSSIRFLSASIKENESIIYPIAYAPPIVEYYQKNLSKYINKKIDNTSFWLLTPPVFFSLNILQNYFNNNALIEEYGVFNQLQSPIWHFQPGGKTYWLSNKKIYNKVKIILPFSGCYILRGRIVSKKTSPLIVYLNDKKIIYSYIIPNLYLGPFSFCSNSKDIILYTPKTDASFQWISIKFD